MEILIDSRVQVLPHMGGQKFPILESYTWYISGSSEKYRVKKVDHLGTLQELIGLLQPIIFRPDLSSFRQLEARVP